MPLGNKIKPNSAANSLIAKSDAEPLPMPAPGKNDNYFDTSYSNFCHVPINTEIWILHKFYIQCGRVHCKKTTILESNSSKGIVTMSTTLELTIKLVANPAVDGFDYVEVTNQPIALTKEDLIKLITLG